MLKKTLLSIAAAAVLIGSASLATAEESYSVSGNVALTSDYKFRGISQSDEDIAIQGGFDFEHESGFYLGTWGSSVDFDTNGDCCDGSLDRVVVRNTLIYVADPAVTFAEFRRVLRPGGIAMPSNPTGA